MAQPVLTRRSLSALRQLACTKHSPAIGSVAAQRRHVSVQQLDEQRQGRERVVILGSGWAGYGLSRSLDPRKHQVVVVSPRSYFVFTPLLAGTSTGTLEFRTAIEPVRARGRQLSQIQYFQGWADAIDLDKKHLTIEEAVGDPLTSRALVSNEPEPQQALASSKKGKTFDLSWNKLVIAVGCYAETFNTKGVSENAFFLKDIGDARAIRRQTLDAFEAASLPTTPVEVKQALLNFAVVGGGPTGIEWAAEMHDFIAEDLSRLYPDIWKLAKVTVYDVAPKVLSMFDERLSKYAMKTFQRQGIEIKTSHHIQELRRGLPDHLKHLQPDSGERKRGYTLIIKEQGEVPIGMCVWSTGLMMNPLVEKLSTNVKQHPKTHAILTDDRMRVQNASGSVYKNVFAIGDCANIEGTSYPSTAQVASQKANWLGKHLKKNDLDTAAFTYRDLGIMAYTGAGSAIFQSGGGDISGWLAWLIWRGVYLTKSVSWRNKVLIPIYWSVNWLFGRDVSRF